jgi:type IX secretion system PorP/SprF family membrane protein
VFSRNQWTGIEGAPTTHAVSFDGALKPNKAGLGGVIQYDQSGLFTNVSALAAYAYRIDINDNSNLSFGLSAGLLSTGYDFSNAVVKTSGDPNLQTETTTSFDGIFGMHYNLSKFQIGVALPHLFASSASNFNAKQSLYYKLSRQYLINTKYNFVLNENTHIEPMVVLRAQPGTPFQYDANVVAYFKQDKIWAGVMYRSYKAITPMIGVKLHDQFVLGYTYDYAFGGTYNKQVAQTHELMIGFNLKKRDDNTEEKKCDYEDRIKKLEHDRDSILKVLENHEERIDSLEMHEDDIAALRKTLDDFKRMMSTKEGRAQIAVGDQYILKTVYFDVKQEVKDTDVAELNDLANILNQNPTMNIQLTGHTDDVGGDDYNITLSQHRAEWAMNYMLHKGVAKNRLTAKGFGKTQPIVSNRTPRGRALNRRVEFVVTQK